MIVEQFALRFIEGHIATYPSEDAARAAHTRMQRWPTTKHTELLVRTCDVGEWRSA